MLHKLIFSSGLPRTLCPTINSILFVLFVARQIFKSIVESKTGTVVNPDIYEATVPAM